MQIQLGTYLRFFCLNAALSWAVALNAQVSVSLGNAAKQLAFYEVTYYASGQPKAKRTTKRTEELGLNKMEKMSLPRENNTYVVRAFFKTLTGEKRIFEKMYTSNLPKCFKVFGTIENPLWNNECF